MSRLSRAALLSVGGTIGAWLFQEFLQDDLTCLKCPKSSSHQASMDWFNGKIAEKPYIWWEKHMVSAYDFPTNPWFQVSMNPFNHSCCCFRKSCCRCINLSSDFGMMLGSIPSGFRGFKHHDENRLVVKGPSNMVVVIFLIARYRIWEKKHSQHEVLAEIYQQIHDFCQQNWWSNWES